MHRGLLESARKLVGKPADNAPSPSDLRRAVSTIYYALFHFVSNSCVDSIFGASVKNLTRARAQAYRSLDHRDIVAACERAKRVEFEFPIEIRDFAETFTTLQKWRSVADYDPAVGGDFNLSHVLNLIDECEIVMSRFNFADADDRRAFAVLVMMKSRNR